MREDVFVSFGGRRVLRKCGLRTVSREPIRMRVQRDTLDSALCPAVVLEDLAYMCVDDLRRKTCDWESFLKRFKTNVYHFVELINLNELQS